LVTLVFVYTNRRLLLFTIALTNAAFVNAIVNKYLFITQEVTMEAANERARVPT